jgi:t-SNARE complex subunit (syntaxin)
METPSQSAPEGPAKVEQVREILFGADLRQIDQNLNRISETIRQQSTELREEMRRRLDAFEILFKKEIEALQAQVRRERDERLAADSQLSRAAHEAGEHGQKRLADHSDQFAAEQSTLRTELLGQMKSLFDEIAARDDRWSKLIESRLGELGHKKTDRTTLATLLAEMAARLGQNPEQDG